MPLTVPPREITRAACTCVVPEDISTISDGDPSCVVSAVLKPDMVRVPAWSVEPGDRTRPSMLFPVPVSVAPSDSILSVRPGRNGNCRGQIEAAFKMNGRLKKFLPTRSAFSRDLTDRSWSLVSISLPLPVYPEPGVRCKSALVTRREDLICRSSSLPVKSAGWK